MDRFKVLILQNEISSYNTKTYNYISEYYDLTVGYLTKDKSVESIFKKKHFGSFTLGPLTIVKGLRSYCKQFDVVSILPNIRIPSYCLLPFLPHKYRVISWSIGFRCSYTHPYVTDRNHLFLDRVFQLILSKCDANVFYMEKSKEFWTETSLCLDNVFIAPNTTDVVPTDFNPGIKKNFLFVGTLYKGKGLDILLKTFKRFKEENNSSIHLIIVGGGEMESELKDYVCKNGLSKDVEFTGPIYDENEISKYFMTSLLCFSPTQAGLSVPKSMGYGVPFVTRKDAITGGEIYHITNGVNGIMYSKDEELLDIMNNAVLSPDKYIIMGKAAKEYYESQATIKHMAEGAMKAINYALQK